MSNSNVKKSQLEDQLLSGQGFDVSCDELTYVLCLLILFLCFWSLIESSLYDLLAFDLPLNINACAYGFWYLKLRLWLISCIRVLAGSGDELTVPVYIAHHLKYLSLLSVRELFVSENITHDSESNSKISVSLAKLQGLGFAENLILKLKTNVSVSAWATQPAKLLISTNYR